MRCRYGDSSSSSSSSSSSYISVAAANASDKAKAAADYVCTGTKDNTVDDAITINEALTAAYEAVGGFNSGSDAVMFSGTFFLNTTVIVQARISMLALDNLQGASFWMRAAGSGPCVYYNANGPGREGQFEISGFRFLQTVTGGDWAVKIASSKAYTLVASATLAGNPPVEGSVMSASGGANGQSLEYNDAEPTTLVVGLDEGDSIANGETITYIGENGEDTFTATTSTAAAQVTSTKDCIFRNNYITISSGGGWYHRADWSGHYENMTFEYCQGNGFESPFLSFTEFNGCYFAHNTEHGFSVEGSNSGASGVVLTSCWSSDNGDVQLGNNPDPESILPFAGYYVDINGTVRDPIKFVGCVATQNSGWGFKVFNGWYSSFTDCFAEKNNWQGATVNELRQGGFSFEETAMYPRLVNCFSQKNDVKWVVDEWTTGTGLANGCGFYLQGDHAQLSTCQTAQNAYGLYVEADDCIINCRHARGAEANIVLNVNHRKGFYGTTYGRLVSDVFDDPGVLVVDGVATNALNNDILTTTLVQPKYSRSITITGTDGTASGSVSIFGIDATGTPIAENVKVVSGTTIASTTRAYSVLTSIKFNNGTGSAKIGWKDTLGLSRRLEYATDIIKVLKNGSVLAAAEYTVAAASGGWPYGTVALTTPIAASDVFEIIYRSQ